MKPHQSVQPGKQTVGIRELKQNPSEIIARAAGGVRFEVLSNGRPVGVVIQRENAVRKLWVGTDALVAMSAGTDATGWAEERRVLVQLEDDSIADPWERRRSTDPIDASAQ